MITETVKIVIQKSPQLAFVFVPTNKVVAVIDTDLGNGLNTRLVIYKEFGHAHFPNCCLVLFAICVRQIHGFVNVLQVVYTYAGIVCVQKSVLP